jgi:hypothetical protein
MIGLRIAVIVVGLVLMSPIIALNVWGINMSMWVGEMTAANEAAIKGEGDLSDVRAMPSNPLSWLLNRVDLRDTFTTDEITNDRYIIFQKVITAQELLADGEAMPDEEFIPLYAAARAPAQLMPYCADVLETVGNACDVIHTTSRENREGKLLLVGRLAFTPVAPLGDPSTIEDGKLRNTTVTLPYEGDLRPANDAASRKALLQQAQSICDELRTQLGNCVLTRVNFTIRELWITDLEALPAGTNPQRLETSAQFTVFLDETKIGARGFRDMVTAMVNPS